MGVMEGTQIAAVDTLQSPTRAKSSFVLNDRYRVALKPNSVVRFEGQSGAVRAVLERGALCVEVPKGSAPFSVHTDHAEARVTGTLFSVALDGKSTVLTVLEGVVLFQNAHGRVDVKANERSVTQMGHRPGAVQPTEAAEVLGWARTPDVWDTPGWGPAVDVIAAGRESNNGIVVCAPYADKEPPSGPLARQVAEILDSGLVLGYGYRNRSPDRGPLLWINLDRGSEVSPEAPEKEPSRETPRSQAAFQRWMDSLRTSLGSARGPVPFLVTFRNHTELLKGMFLSSVEVATQGLSKHEVRTLKSLYAKLLDEERPNVRLMLVCDQTDQPTYECSGRRIKFTDTEEDARKRGYLEPQHVRRALTFYFHLDGDLGPEDDLKYAKILARFIDAASSAR
jgi:hypothetical protein